LAQLGSHLEPSQARTASWWRRRRTSSSSSHARHGDGEATSSADFDDHRRDNVDPQLIVPIHRVYWQAWRGDSRPKPVTTSPKHPGCRRQ
jgi:hypothetical protein